MTKNDLEKLINIYGDSIFGFCCHLCGSREKAEDLYQEAFLQVIERRDRLYEIGDDPKNLESARNYCLGAALNAYRNARKKEGRHPETSLYDTDGGLLYEPVSSDDTEEQVIREEERKRLRQAVRRLPDRLREAVYLVYYMQLSLSETAGILKIPQGTV